MSLCMAEKFPSSKLGLSSILLKGVKTVKSCEKKKKILQGNKKEPWAMWQHNNDAEEEREQSGKAIVACVRGEVISLSID